MIAFLRGIFLYKTPASLVIDVNGVGYEVQISLHTYSAIQDKEKGQLFTYLHIREEGQTLYGFHDVQEREMFLQLIGVSGVGAATARMMLSSLKPAEIAQAIVQANTRQLESIKGIGKKSAERIILELKDKMTKLSLESNIPSLIHNTLEQDALNALVALGIPRPSGQQAIQKVLKSEPGISTVEEVIKKALKNM